MDLTKAEPVVQFGYEFDPEIVRRVQYNSKMNPKNRYYNILNGKRIAIVFNHTKFEYNRCSNMENFDNDISKLQTCFEFIEFEVKLYENIKADEIQRVMNEVAKLDSQVSCLVVVVLTHGDGTHLEAFDRNYEIKTLWKCLEGKMIGIPKLFFIDACRGTKLDKGIEVADSYNIKKDHKFKLPTMADYLFMYSTYDEHLAFTTTKGSKFIEYLCLEIMTNRMYYDVLQILTFVCQDVAVKYDVGLEERNGDVGVFKMMPQIVSMLTKLLRFDVAPK